MRHLPPAMAMLAALLAAEAEAEPFVPTDGTVVLERLPQYPAGSAAALRRMRAGAGGTDLATALASTDVFLNPSITETFGNVTLEAMACGLPVMAAAASGTTSLVQDNVTGRLAEPGDIDAMANELADYQRNPELRRKHGAAGLEFAKTMDWDEINAAVMHVYERVIERRRRLANA